MKLVEWKQIQDAVFISLKTDKGNKEIRLNPKVINYILAQTPKILFIYLYDSGQKYTFMADFKGLQPIVGHQSKLKITVKSNIQAEQTFQKPEKYYVIARGESYQDRYLSPQGWQIQEYPFSIDDEIKEKERQITSEKLDEQNFSQNSEPTETLKQTAPPDSKICPYCNQKIPIELSTCPFCFHSLQSPEQGVDFIL